MTTFLFGFGSVFFICLGIFAWRRGNKRARSVAQAVALELTGVVAGDHALIRWNRREYRCFLVAQRRGEGVRELLRISRQVSCPASYSVQESDALVDAVVSPAISASEQTLSETLSAHGYTMNSPSISWATAWLGQGEGQQHLHALLKHRPTRFVVRPRLSYCDVALSQLELGQSKASLSQLITALDDVIENARYFDPTFVEPPGVAEAFDNTTSPLLGPFVFMATGALALLPLIGLSASMAAHPAGATLEWCAATLTTLVVVSVWHARFKRSASSRDSPRSVYLGGMALIVTGSFLWSIGLARPILQWWSQ